MERTGSSDSRLIFGAGATALCLAGILAVATAINCHNSGSILAPGISWIPSAIYGIILWIWWAVVAYLLWRVGDRYPFLFRATVPNILFQIGVAILVCAIHLVCLHVATRTMGQIWPKWHLAGFDALRFFELGRYTLDFLVYALIWSASAIVRLHIVAQRQAFQALELSQQLSLAKLQALQMQLQPHFLFNTLNAITTLVRTARSKEADAMLTHLNTILKATLSRSTPAKIPLSQELQTVDHYLAIEQTRFADRLNVEMKIDPAALDSLVPCFLLQPIVENAVRHGIAHREKDGLIQTSVARNGSELQLNVRDNGPGTNGNSPGGHGIGLKNIRERLVHFYQDRYDMKITEPQDGGYEVSITIPYEKAHV